jgi:kynurenine formamidase
MLPPAERTGVSTLFWGILNQVGCSRQVLSPPMKSSTYTSAYSHFLAELRDARVSAGVSQVQLAEFLGQLQTYVSKCELGDRRLDVIELRAWVLALGGDPVAFMAGLEDRIARNARLPEHRGSGKKPFRRSGRR